MLDGGELRSQSSLETLKTFQSTHEEDRKMRVAFKFPPFTSSEHPKIVCTECLKAKPTRNCIFAFRDQGQMAGTTSNFITKNVFLTCMKTCAYIMLLNTHLHSTLCWLPFAKKRKKHNKNQQNSPKTKDWRRRRIERNCKENHSFWMLSVGFFRNNIW